MLEILSRQLGHILPLWIIRHGLRPETAFNESGKQDCTKLSQTRYSVTNVLMCLIKPPRTPPTAAAATAAAQAFLANRASNASLSNAAAAAALRSHTTTPTPVSQVQTKRMLQRQSSTSSHGSANGNARRPGGLQRQNSTGSMTERTFREPSPNRSSTPRMMDDDAPPMPPIPRAYASPPPVPAKSARRPASVEPPERIGSPPPRNLGGRGVSLDRGPGGMVGQAGHSKLRKSSLGNYPEHERQDYRASVNFSRPMSAHNTPPTSPLQDTRPDFPSSTVNRNNNNAVSTFPESERSEIQYKLQETARSPVKKKKKYVTQQGSHFANGGLGGKPSGTALETTPRREMPSTSSTAPSKTASAQSDVAVDSNVTVTRKKKKKHPTPDESRIEPPQNNYTSDSDVSERSVSSDRPRVFNTRAAGLLTKQPSVVREDREAEELEERGTVPSLSAIKPVRNGDVPLSAPEISPRISEEGEDPSPQLQVPPIKTSNLAPTSTFTSRPKPALSKDEDNSIAAKRNSLSPSRAAHFSSIPFYETTDDIRHQPPPRSISPAKSAMKHSPSSRGASPVGSVPRAWNLAPGHVPSEASDTTSVVSDEGYRPQPKKKKNVRVSFDDDPTIVGRAVSPPTSPESPLTASPQNRDVAKKGWFGLGRGGNKAEGGAGVEPDDAMRPTPALPSFGSVRGRSDESEMSVSQQKPANGRTPEHLGASNDSIIGAILAQDHTTNHLSKAELSSKSINDELLLSGVTFTEDKGYHSDLGSNNDNEKDVVTHGKMHGSPSTIQAKQDEYQQPSSKSSIIPKDKHDKSVPSISIQPATPGIEESSRNSVEKWLGMPGGYPPSTEFVDQQAPESHTIVEHHATDPTPSAVGISEPLSDTSLNLSSTSPMVGEMAEKLRQQTNVHEDKESESTDDSIYSDAAEDLSDVEGDGFGSINAIVESPTLAVSKPSSTKPTDTTTVEQHSKAESLEPQAEEGWGKAQAYWSGLSQSRKEQLEQDASPIPVETTAIADSKSKPKKKKKAVAKQDFQARDAVPLTKDRVGQEKTAQQTASAQPMRKSMRGQPQATTEPNHMRSSMRSEVALKSGVKVDAPRDPVISSVSPQPRVLPKKPRPVSAVPMVDYKSKENGTVNHNRNTSNGASSKSLTPIPAQIAKKQTKSTNQSLRRTASDGSNSSSSFRKARPITSSENGRYSMRRSMRSSSTDERPRTIHVPQSSAFSLRSNSPAGSTNRRPFSSAGPSMRTSLRESFDAESTRPSKSPTRTLGFGRGTKPKAAPAKSKSRFTSRFGESSDEEGGPAPYNSRFADSSDEDELPKLPSNLTPVRGIPKRIDEGDSTDLEDSSEEALPEAVPTKIAPLKPSKAEGAALASGSLRRTGSGHDLSKSTELGNGFHVSRTAEKEKKKRSFFGNLGRRKDESKVTRLDVESAARRETPLERNKEERVVIPGSPAAQSPRAPKLQRRNTPKRYQSDSWPLPQSPATTHTDSRPNTSDGASPIANGRPALGTRRSTVDEHGRVLGKSGKKKRFPMLRKAFGLHD